MRVLFVRIAEDFRLVTSVFPAISNSTPVQPVDEINFLLLLSDKSVFRHHDTHIMTKLAQSLWQCRADVGKSAVFANGYTSVERKSTFRGVIGGRGEVMF